MRNTEVIMYEHKCDGLITGRWTAKVCRCEWNDEKKISECPVCGQYHIAMSSHLGYNESEAKK